MVKVINKLKIATPENDSQWQDLKLCSIHAQETVCSWLTIYQIIKL